MTDYPNPRHKRADEDARGRAVAACEELEREIRRLRGSLKWGGAGEDGAPRRIAGHAAELTANVTVLAALRDVREWHAAGQAEAPPPETLTATPGVRSYGGQRSCLYCRQRARHDVAGFLACNDPEHIARALEDLGKRRAQEDAMEEGIAAEMREGGSDAS